MAILATKEQRFFHKKNGVAPGTETPILRSRKRQSSQQPTVGSLQYWGGASGTRAQDGPIFARGFSSIFATE